MDALNEVHLLYLRANLTANGTTNGTATAHSPTRPPVYKAIGLTLAIASGLFIGSSFVLKKTGLLRANEKYNEEAGEGYGYLKNAFWWSGMTLMIVGEICNFVAYAFVDAILVTPLGALSVVVTTILSAIFLKERLSFVGKVGCFNCIIGSVIIVMNAPEHSAVADIQQMKHFVISPGFLSYAGVIVLVCAFIAFYLGPKYGKTSMLVYLSICSLIGGLSVVATQGLGSAIVAQAGGKPQFNQWFLYLLLVFVVTTLVTEIIFLNKALNLFNAALVTPTYYVFFTSATIITSAVLFRGFAGTPVQIATMIMGFLQICSGVVLLQLSKSAKDVPDAAIFKGDLDQVRTVAEQEQPESEPKADAIRGAAAIIRRFSVSRQKMEHDEAKRLYDEKRQDSMEPIRENEVVEWDGLRRRKTIIGESPIVPLQRRKTIHPPLGMSHFPSEIDEPEDRPATDGDHRDHPGVFENFRSRASTVLSPGHRRSTRGSQANVRSPMHPVPLTEITIGAGKSADPPVTPYSHDESQEHVYGLPEDLRANPADRADTPRSVGWGRNRGDSFRGEGGSLAPTPPPHRTNRRQFSFQNVFHRARSDDGSTPLTSARPPTASSQEAPPPSRKGMGSRQSSKEQTSALKTATEEERLGLVKGDSHAALYSQQHSTSPTRLPSQNKPKHHYSSSSEPEIVEDYEFEHELDSPDVSYHDRDNDSEEDWQIENKPPRPPMHTPPRAQPATVTAPKPLPSIISGGSPPLPPLPLNASTRSSPSGPVGLPAHPAINVSPERERGYRPTDELGEYGRWDNQQNQQNQQQQQQVYQQQLHQLHSTQQQQLTQQRTQERNITGTGPNKLRKKKREGSEASSSSSVEERELKDYETRSGRRGGDGAFI